MQSGRGIDEPIRVWCGNYRFASEDPFFSKAVKTGRACVDEKARGKPVSAKRFRAEMDVLRKMAPADGHVLLDDLEHRWDDPDAPPALYVVTCEVCVHQSFTLFAGAEALGQAALTSKVGQASRSLAPRIVVYQEAEIRGVSITPGSLALRVAIYGHGPSMVSEGELKQVAKKNGMLLERVHESGARRPVTTESYAGDAIIEAIYAYACNRAAA